MELVNESNFNLKVLRRLIRFCRPPFVTIRKVVFRNSRKCFYAYFLKDTSEIVIGVGPSTFYPLRVERENADIKKGYATDFLLRSKEEAAVYLLSHELQHLRQHEDKTFPRQGSSKTRYSESDAEHFALKKLRNWKKKKEYERKHANRKCSNISDSRQN